jgi:hypothetical protein
MLITAARWRTSIRTRKLPPGPCVLRHKSDMPSICFWHATPVLQMRITCCSGRARRCVLKYFESQKDQVPNRLHGSQTLLEVLLHQESFWCCTQTIPQAPLFKEAKGHFNPTHYNFLQAVFDHLSTHPSCFGNNHKLASIVSGVGESIDPSHFSLHHRNALSTL